MEESQLAFWYVVHEWRSLVHNPKAKRHNDATKTAPIVHSTDWVKLRSRGQNHHRDFPLQSKNAVWLQLLVAIRSSISILGLKSTFSLSISQEPKAAQTFAPSCAILLERQTELGTV